MSGDERHVCTEGADRLDRWLAGWASVGSRRKAAELVASGRVEVDGAPVTEQAGGRPIPARAAVVVRWNKPGTRKAAVVARRGLDDAGIGVLYEDARVLVVDKPPGLLTDTATRKQARERDSVRARVVTMLAARNQRPVVVHRIDRDTSGVVVLAKDAEAGTILSTAFAEHVPERTYLAWVHDVPEAPEGTWVTRVWWDPVQNRLRACVPGGQGMEARASWRCAASYRRVARLEVRLDTGRRNQIRFQAAAAGHPLVGEKQYLPEDWTSRPPHLARQALHAWRVVFPHPDDGRPVSVEAPLPPDLRKLDRPLRG